MWKDLAFTCLGIFAIPIAIFFSQNAMGLDLKCIKVEVVGNEACNKLKVNFDFSSCGADAPKSKSIRTTCVNQKAVAVAKGSGENYIATYASPLKEGGDWRFLTLRSEAKSSAAKAETDSMAVVVRKTDENSAATLPPVVSENISAKAAKPLPAISAIPIVKEPQEIIPAVAPNLPAADDAKKSEPAVKTESKLCTPATCAKPNPVKYSGFFDFYYLSSTSNPSVVTASSTSSSNLNSAPAGNVPYRFADIYHDNFTLALAELSLSKDVQNAGARIDLGFGNEAAVMSPNDIATQNILQANAYYKITDSLKLTAGKLIASATLEDPLSKENFNYSRSLTFTYGEPLWHMGAGLEYQIIPKEFSATLFAFNAWSGVYQSNQKMTGLRLLWNHEEDLSAQYNALMTVQPNAFGGYRQIHEANLIWKPTKDTAFAGDYVWGYQTDAWAGQDAQWNSGEITAKKTWGKFSLSPRIELFYDPQGYAIAGGLGTTGGALPTTQNIMSATLTGSYEVEEGATLILEFREDSSDVQVFKDDSNKASLTQVTGTLACIFVF